MKKIVYIIPGKGEHTKMKSYQEVIRYFEEEKFGVRQIQITWKHRVMTDYVDEFLRQIKHSAESEVYIFGFSFGAMIALIAAQTVKPKGLFLCSLSPYFKEDLPHINKWWKNYMGARRIKDFETISFEQLAKTVTCRSFLFAGTEESVHVQKRVTEAAKKLKNSELFWVEEAKHDLGSKNYLEKVREVIAGCENGRQH